MSADYYTAAIPVNIIVTNRTVSKNRKYAYGNTCNHVLRKICVIILVSDIPRGSKKPPHRCGSGKPCRIFTRTGG